MKKNNNKDNNSKGKEKNTSKINTSYKFKLFYKSIVKYFNEKKVKSQKDWNDYVLEKGKNFKFKGLLKPIILFYYELKKISWSKLSLIKKRFLILFICIGFMSTILFLINYLLGSLFKLIG